VTWRNWRRRVFAPAASKAELGPTARPYHLRHSFVSLLLLEGATVVEVARQARHSPTMTLSTYAHLFEELEGVETRSAEDEIRRAREALRSSRTRFVPETASKAPRRGGKTPANQAKPTPGLEPGTPSLRVKRVSLADRAISLQIRGSSQTAESVEVRRSPQRSTMCSNGVPIGRPLGRQPALRSARTRPSGVALPRTVHRLRERGGGGGHDARPRGYVDGVSKAARSRRIRATTPRQPDGGCLWGSGPR
jgi:hypothetical protein